MTQVTKSRTRGAITASVVVSSAVIAAALGSVALPASGSAHQAAVVARCGFGQLRVTAGPEEAGLGHVGFPVRFTNIGTVACSLHGYPGAEALDKHGKKLANAKRTKNGYLGGDEKKGPPPTVVLEPGRKASALIEGSDVPTGHHRSCPSAYAFRVTPPNTYKAKLLSKKLPDCGGFEVHPVVKGKTGTSERNH